MSELNDLYQEIILDHNRRPRNHRVLDHPSHHSQGHNPLCGDEIHLYLLIEDDKVADVSFDGEGCAISKASASLLTVALKGRSLQEIKAVRQRVMDMLTSQDAGQVDLEEMGDLAALQGVRQFPVRIKCATLAWHALEAALRGEAEASTE